MKIKYVWHEQPKVEKVFDTEVAFSKLPSIFTAGKTQESFDKMELENFEDKKAKGLVLSYEVIEEATNDK